MKINKEEALVLAKLLHQHDSRSYPSALAGDAEKTDFQNTIEDLCERLDDFLVYGEEETDDEEDEHECCDHGEEEEDDDEGDEDLGEEEEDSSEEDEEDDEESGEDEESSEEDDGDDSEDEEELDVDSYAGGDDLHALKAAKLTNGSLEFEYVTGDDHSEKDHVDLVVDGYTELEDITHLKRKGKELHVRDCEGGWSIYDVERFPKGWADVLPLDELVEVEA